MIKRLLDVTRDYLLNVVDLSKAYAGDLKHYVLAKDEYSADDFVFEEEPKKKKGRKKKSK